MSIVENDTNSSRILHSTRDSNLFSRQLVLLGTYLGFQQPNFCSFACWCSLTGGNVYRPLSQTYGERIRIFNKNTHKTSTITNSLFDFYFFHSFRSHWLSLNQVSSLLDFLENRPTLFFLKPSGLQWSALAWEDVQPSYACGGRKQPNLESQKPQGARQTKEKSESSARNELEHYRDGGANYPLTTTPVSCAAQHHVGDGGHSCNLWWLFDPVMRTCGVQWKSDESTRH